MMMNTELNKYAAITFLALTIWREARGESYDGKVAVACSIMNRVDRPSWWGKDVLSVVFKKWQYSSLTDPKDPQLTKWPTMFDGAWSECLVIAMDAYERILVHPMPGADSYHDISIPTPYWAKQDMYCGQIGKLKFYNVDHDYEKV
jgi:N-acetylmuramoyl-L-alanine amidase